MTDETSFAMGDFSSITTPCFCLQSVFDLGGRLTDASSDRVRVSVYARHAAVPGESQPGTRSVCLSPQTGHF